MHYWAGQESAHLKNNVAQLKCRHLLSAMSAWRKMNKISLTSQVWATTLTQRTLPISIESSHNLSKWHKIQSPDIPPRTPLTLPRQRIRVWWWQLVPWITWAWSPLWNKIGRKSNCCRLICLSRKSTIGIWTLNWQLRWSWLRLSMRSWLRVRIRSTKWNYVCSLNSSKSRF